VTLSASEIAAKTDCTSDAVLPFCATVAMNRALPARAASSSGVSFTINHIAAVAIPAALGWVWLYSHTAVFLVGTAFALCSLILSRNVPRDPAPGNEVVLGRRFAEARVEAG